MIFKKDGREVFSPIIEPVYVHSEELLRRSPYEAAMQLNRDIVAQREAYIARAVIALMLAAGRHDIEVLPQHMIDVINWEATATPNPETGGHTFQLRRRKHP